MADDYRRNAVNKAIFELFCSDEKYRTKNKALLERSKATNQEWVQLRDAHTSKMGKQLDIVLAKHLPHSVRQSIEDISSHYEKYIDVMDLDIAVNENMTEIFKRNRNRIESEYADTEHSEDSDCPGQEI